MFIWKVQFHPEICDEKNIKFESQEFMTILCCPYWGFSTHTQSQKHKYMHFFYLDLTISLKVKNHNSKNQQEFSFLLKWSSDFIQTWQKYCWKGVFYERSQITCYFAFLFCFVLSQFFCFVFFMTALCFSKALTFSWHF